MWDGTPGISLVWGNGQLPSEASFWRLMGIPAQWGTRPEVTFSSKTPYSSGTSIPKSQELNSNRYPRQRECIGLRGLRVESRYPLEGTSEMAVRILAVSCGLFMSLVACTVRTGLHWYVSTFSLRESNEATVGPFPASWMKISSFRGSLSSVHSRAGSSAKVGYLSCRAQFKVKMVGPFSQEAGKSAISHSNIDPCPSFVVSVMVFIIFCLTSCSFWLCSFGSPLEILAGRGEIFTDTGPLSSLCKTSRKWNKYICQPFWHPLPIVF